MTKILPQADWVVFEEVKEDDVQKHGAIFIPTAQSADLPIKRGKVLILGPEAGECSAVAVGDLVLYHQKIGIPFMVDGKKQLLTKAENFYCILKEDE